MHADRVQLRSLPRAAPVSTRGDVVDWRGWAACALSDDDEAWFPPSQGGSALDAKRICVDCPVRVECLTFAMANESGYRHGVVGGMTPRERTRLGASGWRPGDPVPEMAVPAGHTVCPDCGTLCVRLGQHRARSKSCAALRAAS